MNELSNILKDIKNGMLRWDEIPGFVLWLIGRFFWPLFGIILIGLGLLMGR